jgi:hypothetical protein
MNELMVISGIAIPDWIVNDHDLHRDTVQVQLGVYALNIQALTVDVALCSVANGGSAFTFAVDDATVDLSPSGEMTLTAAIAVQGSGSALSRFSYQIVALVNPASPLITGTVTWQGLWQPAGDQPADLATANQNLGIQAYQVLPTPPGSLIPITQPVGGCSVTSMSISDGEVVAVYEITSISGNEIPFGQPLLVQVSPSSAFSDAASPQMIIVTPTSGPEQFTLTPASPQQSGIDFLISAENPPR